MRTLVIGGSGFIGTVLVRNMLDKGIDVSILDKRQSEVFPHLVKLCDVRKRDDVLESLAGYDLIVHLAAEHADDVSPPSLYYDVNVEGMRNVLQAASNHGISKIIFTSTVAVYGLNKGNSKEDSCLAPFNDYGKSKMMAENLIDKWCCENANRSAVVIRPCVVFGEENRGNVYNLMSQVARKKFIMIGNGLQKKSMAYVGNIAEFLTYMAAEYQSKGMEVFNYADKPDLSSGEIVAAVQAELGHEAGGISLPAWLGLMAGGAFDVISFIIRRKMPISYIRIKKFLSETQVASDKVQRLPFKAPFSLTEGLSRMVRHEFNGK